MRIIDFLIWRSALDDPSSACIMNTTPFPLVEIDAPFAPPEKKIHSDADVALFNKSVAFERIVWFIELLNKSVSGKTLLDNDIQGNPRIEAVVDLLDVLNTYIDEIPPAKGPRRFGNIAFRQWIRRLEEVITWKHQR